MNKKQDQDKFEKETVCKPKSFKKGLVTGLHLSTYLQLQLCIK